MNYRNPPTRKIGDFVHNYPTAKRYLAGKREKKLANNTTIRDDGDAIRVRLHHTDIVTYYPDGRIELRSGGYQTRTTAQRINELIPPPFGLSRWNMHGYGGGEVRPFREGMILESEPERTERNPGRKRTPKLYPDIGAVSEGTLRTEDLGNAFSYVAREYGGLNGRKLAKEWDQWAEQDEDERNEDDGSDIVAELEEMLGELAAPYTYFGTDEGDGAWFGYLPAWDSIRDAIHDGDVLEVGDLSDVPRFYSGDVWEVNDHGNGTMWSFTKGKGKEIWSVV